MGAFGVVYPFQTSSGSDEWVIKHILAKDPTVFHDHLQEVVIGFSNTHPATLKTEGYCIQTIGKTNASNLFIKMPRMKESLRQIICNHAQNNTFFAREEVIRYFYSLSTGLEYLESKSIAHRDVKPDNILLDQDGGIKLSDFGSSFLVSPGNNLHEVVGTRFYMAPELIDMKIRLKDEVSFKSDVWSLGITMLLVCLIKVEGKTVEERVSRLESDLALVKRRYGSKLANMLRKLLSTDYEQRPSFKEISHQLREIYPDILVLYINMIFDFIGQ